MVVLCGQILLHRARGVIAISLEKFMVTNWSMKLFHLEQFAIPYGGKLWGVLTSENLAKNHPIAKFLITNVLPNVNAFIILIIKLHACSSLLHSSFSHSVGLLHIYLYPWYPLIINSIVKQEEPSVGPSDITQPACKRVQITYTELRHSYLNLFLYMLN